MHGRAGNYGPKLSNALVNFRFQENLGHLFEHSFCAISKKNEDGHILHF